jgi:hypothetical protein
LNLTDAFTRQRSAKKAHHATQLSTVVEDSEPPKWMLQMFPMMAAVMGGMAYRAQEHAIDPHTPLRTSSTPLISIPSPVITPVAVLDTPSPTALKRPANDAPPGPIIFPDIDMWLSSLDSHPIQGRKNLNYAQHAEGLMAHGILDLGDLLSLTAEKVLELAGPTINFGTANRLIMFRQEDQSELQRQVKKVRLD